MNISLTPELEEFVLERANSGLYHSASEVIREALRLFKDHEKLREIRLEEFRKEVMKGVEQIERGEVGEWDIEKIKARARAKWEARKR